MVSVKKAKIRSKPKKKKKKKKKEKNFFFWKQFYTDVASFEK